MNTQTPYKITEIKNYTSDIKLFRVKCNMSPLPGEFIEASIPGIGECPLASCSYNKTYIDMLTRNAGNVTSAIFQKKTGEEIFIRGPLGKGWPLKKLKNKNLILVAGGTGLAPITSMIEYIEKNRNLFKEIYIYLGFRNENYILLKDRLENWKKKFNLIISLDKKIMKTDKFKCEIGFVHEVLAKHNPELKNTIALLCGPEIMMDCVTNKLIGKGLKPNKIYWSLERRMECGFGSCGRCQLQDVYVCKDGPIFRYDIIKPKIDNENSANEVI
jgi:anaerobic sulfite reductase subunit B